MSSLRFMRALVFFDLPTLTIEDRKNYRNFRKILIKNGFIMLQEYVYCKMLTTPAVEKSVHHMLMLNKPSSGVVQYLTVTEKQFAKMEFIVGENSSDVIDSEDRLIIL